MPIKDKELREAIKLGVKTLILQEVRLLRLERSFTPHLIIEEISHSIQDTKKEIVKLTKTMVRRKEPFS